MRICLIYDCLYPHTVGGAERWYRSLAERLAADGHDVTYLTLRQWGRGASAGVEGVEVRAVGPRMKLYTPSGRRRILPPIVFGAGVFLFLLRNRRRFDAVHTASFPYFSLLAVAVAERRGRGQVRLVVDWHEVWTRDYWAEYLGAFAGRIGWWVQKLCARVPQHAFCFSGLHAERLGKLGLRGEVTVLRGEYGGPRRIEPVDEADPLIVFAGRLIPEKRVALAVAAFAAAHAQLPDLRAVFYGDGPERTVLDQAIRDGGLEDVVQAPGFVASEQVQADIRRALCVLVTSRREGYGMVVVETAAAGTPSVVVTGDDNATVELIEHGVNGLIVDRPHATEIGSAIVAVARAGRTLRESTQDWFARNADALSLTRSLDAVSRAYRGELSQGLRREPHAQK
jgi:glycosyltransferase involved in cell wall biosynthesis